MSEGSVTLDAARILLSKEYSNLLLRQVSCYLDKVIIDKNDHYFALVCNSIHVVTKS